MGIKSLDELRKIKENSIKKVRLRGSESFGGEHTEILVGMATCGIAAGAREVLSAITEELDRQDIRDVKVIPVGCMGYCRAEPMIQVNIPNEKPCVYGYLKPSDISGIIAEHIKDGKPVNGKLLDIDVVLLTN